MQHTTPNDRQGVPSFSCSMWPKQFDKKCLTQEIRAPEAENHKKGTKQFDGGWAITVLFIFFFLSITIQRVIPLVPYI